MRRGFYGSISIRSSAGRHRIARRSRQASTGPGLPLYSRPCMDRLLLPLIAAVGYANLVSLAAQVLWVRKVTLLFGATAGVFASVLAVMLAGLACRAPRGGRRGGGGGRPGGRRPRPPGGGGALGGPPPPLPGAPGAPAPGGGPGAPGA